MDTKNIFLPELKKIAIALLLFHVIGLSLWVPVLSSIRQSGFSLSFRLSALGLAIASGISYVLSCYLVANFRWDYINKLPWSIKLVLAYLSLRVISIIGNLLVSIAMLTDQNLLLRMFYSSGGIPILSMSLLMTSFVFLLIRHKYSYQLGMLYFLFPLINPLTTEGLLFFSPNAQYSPVIGTIFQIASSIVNRDLQGFFIMTLGSLFYVSVLVTLYINSKIHEEKSYENMLVIAIIVTYILSNNLIRFFV